MIASVNGIQEFLLQPLLVLPVDLRLVVAALPKLGLQGFLLQLELRLQLVLLLIVQSSNNLGSLHLYLISDCLLFLVQVQFHQVLVSLTAQQSLLQPLQVSQPSVLATLSVYPLNLFPHHLRNPPYLPLLLHLQPQLHHVLLPVQLLEQLAPDLLEPLHLLLVLVVDAQLLLLEGLAA